MSTIVMATSTPGYVTAKVYISNEGSHTFEGRGAAKIYFAAYGDLGESALPVSNVIELPIDFL